MLPQMVLHSFCARFLTSNGRGSWVDRSSWWCGCWLLRSLTCCREHHMHPIHTLQHCVWQNTSLAENQSFHSAWGPFQAFKPALQLPNRQDAVKHLHQEADRHVQLLQAEAIQDTANLSQIEHRFFRAGVCSEPLSRCWLCSLARLTFFDRCRAALALAFGVGGGDLDLCLACNYHRSENGMQTTRLSSMRHSLVWVCYPFKSHSWARRVATATQETCPGTARGNKSYDTFMGWNWLSSRETFSDTACPGTARTTNPMKHSLDGTA